MRHFVRGIRTDAASGMETRNPYSTRPMRIPARRRRCDQYRDLQGVDPRIGEWTRIAHKPVAHAHGTDGRMHSRQGRA